MCEELAGCGKTQTRLPEVRRTLPQAVSLGDGRC